MRECSNKAPARLVPLNEHAGAGFLGSVQIDLAANAQPEAPAPQRGEAGAVARCLSRACPWALWRWRAPPVAR